MPSWTSSESRVISDDDLPSEYYKELLYGMLQKHKELKKHVDYEQLINVLAMDKSSTTIGVLRQSTTIKI
ncbi:hypothetical protein Tco_1378259 [Tanacetum coccineum]